MISGWFVVFGLIAIVYIVIRVINTKQDWAARLVWVLFIFVVISLGYMLINNDHPIKGPKDVFYLTKNYFSWLGSFFSNVKTVTGNAVNMTWNQFDDKGAEPPKGTP